MTTIIHNRSAEPALVERDENWVGTLLVGIVLVILAILFFVYALPALRSTTPTQSTVSVPDRIDLNVTPSDTTNTTGGTGKSSTQ